MPAASRSTPTYFDTPGWLLLSSDTRSPTALIAPQKVEDAASAWYGQDFEQAMSYTEPARTALPLPNVQGAPTLNGGV